MKICVFGLGAIGGHLANRFALNGHDVSVIARGATLDAVRTNGLTLKDGTDEWNVRPKAFDKSADAGVQDYVIVSVKTPALAEIAPQLAPLIGPDTTVAFVVNGVPWWLLSEISNDMSQWSAPIAQMISSLSAVVPRDRIIGALTYSANHVAEPGVVWNSSPTVNRFMFGETDGAATDRVRAIAAAATNSTTNGVTSDSIRDAMWIKLFINVVTGPLSGLTGGISMKLFNDPELAPLITSMNEEMIAVAAACGSKSPRSAYQPVKAVGNHRPSMLQDFDLSRKPEIDTILGAVVDIGKIKGVPTPSLGMVLPLLRAKARYQGIYP